MRAGLDVVVATGTAMATMAIGLLVVPVYLRVLGVEAYGLVGFLALLQGLLQLLDLGLIPTISREVASGHARKAYEPASQLLFALGRLYVGVGIAIGALVALAAPWIATMWLTPKSLDITTVRDVVVLIGLVLAFRWPAGLFTGALIGGHRLSLVSVINLGASCVGSLGGIAAILLVPRIEMLVGWQALTALAQLLVLRHFAWRVVGRSAERAPIGEALRRVWKFSAGMGGITLIAVAISQLDKVLLSRLVTLEAFGLYTLATVAGRMLYSLTNPMYNVIAPRFTAMAELKQDDALRHAYRQWTTLFCGVFFSATMVVAVAARPLLELWTRDPAIAAQAAPLVALIAVGSALHSVMYFPFALQVAVGDAKTPLLINSLLLAIYVPLLAALTWSMGAFGAALSWLLLFAIYVPLGTWITHRRLLPGMTLPWLAIDVGVPLAMAVAGGLLAEAAQRAVGGNTWPMVGATIICAGLACFASLAVALFRFAELRLQGLAWLRSARSALESRR